MRDNAEIVQIIKSLLESKNKKATDLAKFIGVSRSAMSQYLNGHRGFPINRIGDAANFLGTTSEYLLGLREKKEVSVNYYNYIDAKVSAGIPSNVDPFTSSDLQTAVLSKNLLDKYKNDQDLMLMKVSGESMNRCIPDGSVIGVKRVNSIHDLQNGDVVVFSEAGDFCVKRIYINKELELVDFLPDSTDKSFQPISYLFPNMNNVEIFGKVVFHTIFDD